MGGGSPRKRARCVVLRQVIGHCVMATRLIPRVVSSGHKNRLVSRADLGEGELCLEALGPRGRQVRKVL